MKKWSILIMFVLIFSITLMGCQAPEEEVAEETTNIVTDMQGREVELPAEINTIAATGKDAFRIIVQLGAQEKLVGVPGNSYNSKSLEGDDTLEALAWPEGRELEEVGAGSSTEINFESLTELNPDVILHRGTVEDADLLQEKTLTPVFCIYISDPKSPGGIEPVETAYTLIGEMTGNEERATELVNYFKSEIKALNSVIEKNNPEPARYFMSGGRGNPLHANNSYLPLKELGLVSVAEELGEKGGEVTKEQLIAWDPSIIFLFSNSKASRVEYVKEFQDPIYAPISAIENDQIYFIKAHFGGWDIASGLVDAHIIAKAAYPDLFTDIDIEKKGEEILKTFYNTEGLYPHLNEGATLPSFK